MRSAAAALHVRLAACRVFVRDVLEARAFYARRLQLTVVAEDLDAGYCALDAGGVTLVIERVPADAPETDQVLVGRFTGLSFEVTDIAATYREFCAADVEFAETPARQPWGGITATLFDPAGNVLQLVQYPR